MSEPTAKCGHADLFGFLADTYCRECADKGRREAAGLGCTHASTRREQQ